jgi:hypothetical protein
MKHDAREPGALKGACQVRGGAVGNVPGRVTRWPPTLRQVHRLKLLKRQAYGRASFGMLRKRVLRRAW